ncbi:MAG: endonuclease [Dehalococcoidales bacterium]|jgi:endonuclease-3 related protein
MAAPSESRPNILREIYRRLYARYGPQHWWPAQTPFEVMAGAVLTQSAAWSNVEKAIKNLEGAGKLAAAALRQIPEKELAGLIYSCGYYNTKARKLKALAGWLGEQCGDDLDRLFTEDTASLRHKLLGVYGVGEETSDAILLYAGNKPVFVIDAYTRRIVERLGLAPERRSYADYQSLFMSRLPVDSRLFNEYHALLVRLGKEVCRKQPRCADCCLNPGGKTQSGRLPCAGLAKP